VLRTPAAGSAAPLQPALRAGKSPATRAARLLVAAGLLLAAFCGGWLLRPAAPHTTIARSLPVSEEPVDRGQVDPAPPIGSETGPSGPNLHLAGIVTLQIDQHGKPVEVQVPVLAGSDDDVKRLLEKPPAIEASVLQALERRGHKVAAHRQLVAVDLKDGRKLVFPIDQVDVRFAQRVFQ